MRWHFGLTLSFSLLMIAIRLSAAEVRFESPQQLNDLWQSEAIYFVPKDKSAVLNWTGTLLRNTSGKCYQLSQGQKTNQVTSTEVRCESAFLKKATELYTKIPEFRDYKSRLLGCLKLNDQRCLRGLISRTMQVSFGVDGFQDRRDWLVANWNPEDYRRLHDLIERGTVGGENSKTFPPEGTDGGGYRGEFRRENGAWLLKSFVAGD